MLQHFEIASLEYLYYHSISYIFGGSNEASVFKNLIDDRNCLSAGPRQIWSDEFFSDDVIAIPTRMLKRFGGYKMGGAEGHGDSMYLTQTIGDIVIFATQLVSGNGIYALSIDDEVYVKRLEFDPFNDTVTVSSDNEKYQPRLPPGETDRIKILGKILGKVIGRFMVYW
jgi:hypothetical protein